VQVINVCKSMPKVTKDKVSKLFFLLFAFKRGAKVETNCGHQLFGT